MCCQPLILVEFPLIAPLWYTLLLHGVCSPVITGNIPSKRFLLYAENLGSIERDAPIYYRKLNVGWVEDFKLNDDGRSVQ